MLLVMLKFVNPNGVQRLQDILVVSSDKPSSLPTFGTNDFKYITRNINNHVLPEKQDLKVEMGAED